MGLRALLKSVAERTAVAAGGPGMLRAIRAGNGVIVNYHNVVPDGERPGGDPSLHISRSDFARQLDLLMQTCTVVDLESLIGANGDVDARSLASVTFDDGYRGALTAGLDELASRGLPCTVFVPPGLLGAEALWWDALGAGDSGGLSSRMREEALVRAKGRPEDVHRWAARNGLTARAQPRHAGLVSEDELDVVLAREGIAVGAHGWSHANLTELSERELKQELAKPLTWLRERFPGRTVEWLSLPYGRWDDRVVLSAVREGYRGVLDLSGKLVPTGDSSDPHRIPRKNIPAGISPEGFVLRVAGL